MKLTENEKLIWAAVFAKNFSLSNPPSHVVNPNADDEWRKWEANQTLEAIEEAASSITHLRSAREALQEGWGDDSPEWMAYREMMG